VWSSATNPSPGAYAVMEPDGNFVVDRASGNALWSSRTSGNPGAYLSLSDTGQLEVISPSGSPLWPGSCDGTPVKPTNEGRQAHFNRP